MIDLVHKLDESFKAKYEIVKKLGEGAVGLVLLCKQRDLDRLVAIKLFTRDLHDKSLKRRFKREAEILSRFRHENVVAVFDFDVTNEIPYLVQEYLSGKPLDEFLQKNGPLEVEQAIDFAMQIAAGLQHAHLKQIIHRDLKPANIIVSDDGKLKLVDFGLAQGPTSMTRLTKTGTVMGTPYYMAPEQLTESSTAVSADLYSLGVILYEMLTGKMPYFASSLPALLNKKLEGKVIPIESASKRQLPKKVVTLVEDLMSQDASQRPPNAQNVIERLKTKDLHPKASRAPKIGKRLMAPAFFVLLLIALLMLATFNKEKKGPVARCAFTSCQIEKTPLSIVLSAKANQESRLTCHISREDGSAQFLALSLGTGRSWEKTIGPFCPDKMYKVKLLLLQQGREQVQREFSVKTSKWLIKRFMDNKKIYYQPALWKNKLAISFRPGELVCYDSHTLKQLWKISEQIQTGQLRIDEQAVYVTEVHHATIHAFDHLDGSQLWRRRLSGEFDKEVFATKESLFIRVKDDGIHCLDKRTGETKWRTKGSVMAPWAANEEVVVHNKMVRVLPYQKVLSAKDGTAMKGESKPTSTALSDYFLHNGRLYYVNLNHEIMEFMPGKRARYLFRPESRVIQLAIGNSRIYALSAVPPYIVCHSLADNSSLWRIKFPNNNNSSSTLMYWNELLFITAADHGLFVFCAASGRELYRTESSTYRNFGTTVGPFGCMFSVDEKTIGYLPKFEHWPPETRIELKSANSTRAH